MKENILTKAISQNEEIKCYKFQKGTNVAVVILLCNVIYLEDLKEPIDKLLELIDMLIKDKNIKSKYKKTNAFLYTCNKYKFITVKF